MSGTDGWTPLVDEPPPLDWNLEDLFTSTGHAGEDRRQAGCLSERKKMPLSSCGTLDPFQVHAAGGELRTA